MRFRVRRWLLLALVALQLGLGALVLAPGTQAEARRGVDVPLIFGGVSRTYRLYVPPTLRPGVPASVVLALHGLRGTPESIQSYTGMDDVAERERFIVAYPAGLRGSWNAGTCCGGSAQDAVDDVGFLAAVIADIRLKTMVDRVYAAGFSNGAMMVQRLACTRPDLVLAIAAAHGTLVADCRPDRPVSTLHVNGRRDGSVPYLGTSFSQSLQSPLRAAPVTVGTWERLNRCAGLPAVSTTGTVTRRSYGTCAGGSSVRFVTLGDGAHDWPTAPSDGYDASDEIWSFFAAVRTWPTDPAAAPPALTTRTRAVRRPHREGVLVSGEVTGRYDVVIDAPVVVDAYQSGRWRPVAQARTDVEGRFAIPLRLSRHARLRVRYVGVGQSSVATAA